MALNLRDIPGYLFRVGDAGVRTVPAYRRTRHKRAYFRANPKVRLPRGYEVWEHNPKKTTIRNYASGRKASFYPKEHYPNMWNMSRKRTYGNFWADNPDDLGSNKIQKKGGSSFKNNVAMPYKRGRKKRRGKGRRKMRMRRKKKGTSAISMMLKTAAPKCLYIKDSFRNRADTGTMAGRHQIHVMPGLCTAYDYFQAGAAGKIEIGEDATHRNYQIKAKQTCQISNATTFACVVRKYIIYTLKDDNPTEAKSTENFAINAYGGRLNSARALTAWMNKGLLQQQDVTLDAASGFADGNLLYCPNAWTSSGVPLRSELFNRKFKMKYVGSKKLEPGDVTTMSIKTGIRRIYPNYHTRPSGAPAADSQETPQQFGGLTKHMAYTVTGTNVESNLASEAVQVANTVTLVTMNTSYVFKRVENNLATRKQINFAEIVAEANQQSVVENAPDVQAIAIL